MLCTILGSNIKIFGKSVHSLARIGEELYFEPQENELALKTVNSSRSAYACYLFSKSFFLSYSEKSNENDCLENMKCKIGMKSCISVFKSLSHIEKTVEKCVIRLNLEEARLVFQLYCHHGIIKTHDLSFIECESLKAVFSKNGSSNSFTSQSRLLSVVANSFQTNQEEVTLIPNNSKITFKNYNEDDNDKSKVLNTQLCLDVDEFEKVFIQQENEITFCLKELRAILSFSESFDALINVYFESAGKPIIFSIDSDPGFQGTYVLSTMAPRNLPQESQANTTQDSFNCTAAQELPGNSHQNHSKDNASVSRFSNKSVTKTKEKEKNTLHNFLSVRSDLDNEEEELNRNSSNSQFITNRKGEKRTREKTDSVHHDESDEDPVPGTPPKETPSSKKFKSLFLGLSQATLASQRSSQVLAQDTDDEDG